MKIFDCFLFFNELDLLEIRLNYLYNHVDYFVLVESEITFQGNKKDCYFEKNRERFSKYLDKIIYFKIDAYEYNFNALPYIESPKNEDENLINIIFRSIDECPHFDKKLFWWGNDFFQRECILRALAKIKPSNDDIILLSDADEIINIDTLNSCLHSLRPDTIYYCKQMEFYYFLNYFHNTDWIGTSFYLYGSFKHESLNSIRFGAKRKEKHKIKLIENAGWHFTSLGDIKAIKKKISSWGHKEFNNNLILSALKYNIDHGHDIFRRKNFGKLTYMPNIHKVLPLFIDCDISNYSHLIGPPIKNESWITNIIFSLYFRIARRFF